MIFNILAHFMPKNGTFPISGFFSVVVKIEDFTFILMISSSLLGPNSVIWSSDLKKCIDLLVKLREESMNDPVMLDT